MILLSSSQLWCGSWTTKKTPPASSTSRTASAHCDFNKPNRQRILQHRPTRHARGDGGNLLGVHTYRAHSTLRSLTHRLRDDPYLSHKVNVVTLPKLHMYEVYMYHADYMSCTCKRPKASRLIYPASNDSIGTYFSPHPPPMQVSGGIYLPYL
jgi:hypothetical protein